MAVDPNWDEKEKPPSVKHRAGANGLLFYLGRDVQAHMIAFMFDTHAWPEDDSNLFQLPRHATSAHLRLIIEVTSDNMVQIKLFVPRLDEIMRRFTRSRVKE